MKGCIDCRHYESELDFNNNLKSIRKCAMGKNNDMVKWWERNSNVKREDYVEIMECHESTDTVKSLDKMLDLASEILEKLKEYNK